MTRIIIPVFFLAILLWQCQNEAPPAGSDQSGLTDYQRRVLSPEPASSLIGKNPTMDKAFFRLFQLPKLEDGKMLEYQITPQGEETLKRSFTFKDGKLTEVVNQGQTETLMYDAEGKLIAHKESVIEYDGDRLQKVESPNHVEYYEYDGPCYTQAIISKENDRRFDRKFCYDPEGRLAQDQVVQPNGTRQTLQYQYDDAGRVDAQLFLRTQGSDTLTYQVSRFLYNERGLLQQKEVIQPSRNFTQIVKHTYEFSESAPLSVRKTMATKDNPISIITYTFNEEGLLAEKRAEFPKQETTRYRYE